MNTSERNAFNSTSPHPKICDKNTLSNDNQKMPTYTQSEKLMASHTSTSGVKSWSISFEHLLQEPAALATFAEFLKLEFSAENIYFWISCERYRNTENLRDRQTQAKLIFQRYLANGCRDPVNLDSQSRNLSEEMLENAGVDLFVAAQKQIFHLMKFDSYQRFIRSDLYKNCIQAEAKNQPLPFGSENLESSLKTSHLQNASPKLKKSASCVEDRRRKIVLPWHRKTRSKSRDRVDPLNEKTSDACKKMSDSSNAFNNLLAPSSKLNVQSSIIPHQNIPPAEKTDYQEEQRLKTSLPTSLKAVESGCSLCRVKFCDGATTIVQIKPNETIQQLVERILEKRALCYKLYDVVIKGRSKNIDLHASTQEIAGEEVEIEPRVTFKIYLPDTKVITVKSKPKKYLQDVLKPILEKYNYGLDTVDVVRRDNHNKIDLSQFVTVADNLRLQIVLRNGESGNFVNYQNDNISMKWIKPNELESETTARDTGDSSFQSNLGSSQRNLDSITNSIFNDIIQDKANPEYTLQPTDQYSIKSEECGSESSSKSGRTNAKKDLHVLSMIRLKNKNYTFNSQHFTENGTEVPNEFKRPIIAKMKAGVKLQLTERVAEKQDDLPLSSRLRLDNHSSVESYDNGNENTQISAVNLRRVRANLSPVNKAIPINDYRLSLERPLPLAFNSLSNKIQVNRRSSEVISENKSDGTNVFNKGPPPLPPKPKVIPSRPSNWGLNVIN